MAGVSFHRVNVKKQTIKVEPFGEVRLTTTPQAKNIRLRVINGRLVVTRPRRAPITIVRSFIAKNEKWIQKKIADSKVETVIHDGDIVAPGFQVFFMKTSNSETSVKQLSASVVVKLSSNDAYSDLDVQELLIAELKRLWREESKKYIPRRLDQLAQMHGFEYNQLRLKDIRTRWGSCSSKGNININIQLIKLDDELIDHVLLHELSHTKALNHGEDFWNVFESVRPGAKQERKQLKQMTIF